ncbi:leucine--tRNA ligase [Candidatus Bathyarchaeota archaeon RBG_16_57_9]|nr:MAG: leucine--tRNA ligase [Candidatus Bathyarchaeota archaeon RBG_16_57_9]
MVDWKQIEEKWQKRWAEAKVYETDPDPQKPKYYLTVAYPYPNSPQHIGHGRTYTLTDVHARYMRMHGYNVLFPMAWHYTGTPLFAMVERLKEKDPALLETFLNLYNIPRRKLKSLENPVAMAGYFAEEIKHGMQRIGYSVDWRREFTTVDEYYHKFIEWQFAKLREKGYITQGSHPVGWCPGCGNPVGQHDTVGDKEPEIEEFTVIKFTKDELVFPAGTLRPETVYGVTNMWLNPDAVYVEATVDGETWVVSAEAAEKLKLLGHKIEVMDEFQGSRFIGATLTNPATGTEMPILPAGFVDPKAVTGVVMSVPAHAPFDLVALEQLKRDVKKNPSAYKFKPAMVRGLEPISVIEAQGYGESPAVDVVARMGIMDQGDERLGKATKEVYSAEFHGGRMRGNAGQYASLPVQQAKEAVKQDMVAKGTATTMYELLEPVRCRCGADVVVMIFENQWFINYGDHAWKRLAHENIDAMDIVPRELRQEYHNVIDWLREKACARKAGLGTKLPWAEDWIIEALSDSVIYMAYYTVIKGINQVKPEPESLTEDFWDYVFLGKGEPVKVSVKTGFPEEKLEELRREFTYFYPMDARHSGRDLISNHLTYMVFVHDGVWPREMWPRGIYVNGSVLMEGAKMSKSLNNIIPLINAVEMFGADPLRLSLMITAEPLKDADFSPELAKSMKDNLEKFHARAQGIVKQGKGSPKDLRDIDRWMLSRLQGHIADAQEAMTELKVRKTIHAALYELNQDLEWYTKRVAKQRDLKNRAKAIHHVEWTVLDTQIRMLAPFTPHLSEEIWESMGGEGFAAFAEYPKPDESLAQRDSEVLETIVQNSMEDVQNITKVTGIKPVKVHFYTADGWKWKMYLKALELSKRGTLDVGALIKEAFKDEEMKTRAKVVPGFARTIVEDVVKLPASDLEMRLRLGQLNEVAVLQDAAAYMEAELGCATAISGESDPWIEDPAKRAGRSKPYRPAIYVE